MATLLFPNGDKKEVTPKDPKNGFSLEEMYSMLECELIEVLHAADGKIFVVDEDGRLKDSAVNAQATDLYGYPLVGNVLVCKKGEIQ